MGSSSIRGYSAAEQALYWAADHARPGAAVEVSLSPGERLTARMISPADRRTERHFRDASIFVNADDDGSLTASPEALCHLKVELRRTAFGASELAPLSLRLPAEVALVVFAADGRLVHARPALKELTAEVQPAPARPHPRPVPALTA